jgi:actin-related protein 5
MGRGCAIESRGIGVFPSTIPRDRACLDFEEQENVLDYAFVQLGIDTPSIDHPVLMTERLCTPMHSRARKLPLVRRPIVKMSFCLETVTSELMFEQYSVPSLAYCVDSIMSFYHDQPEPKEPFTSDGLLISFNTASTSVLPILSGKGIMSHAKRCDLCSSPDDRALTYHFSIPWGASQSTDYLLKLIQLKYPSFPTRVTSSQSNVRRCCLL